MEIKVVPQIRIVNKADKWPIVLFCSMLIASHFLFSQEYLSVGSGGQTDKTVELVSKMALVGEARLHGGIYGGNALF